MGVGHADRLIATLAAAQHGRVARRQLLSHGIGPGAIDHRVRIGRLHVVFPGVYAVGHPAGSRESRWMSAVLAAGRGACLSHRSAAALWGLRELDPRVVDITTPRKTCLPPAIRAHQEKLPADEVGSLNGIPVTSAARTNFDLASVLAPHQLEAAINEVEVLELWGPLSLPDLLERHPRRRGAPALRSILAARRIGTSRSRTEMESRFLGFLDRFGLPRPVTNTVIEARGCRWECDCVWRASRVIAELDGRGAHLTGKAFETDRLRDRTLTAAGWLVIRITWAQLEEAPASLAEDFHILLARCSS